MLDVRNAIARILDRTTLEHVVEITLRKMRRDRIIVPFAQRSINLQELLSAGTDQALAKG